MREFISWERGQQDLGLRREFLQFCHCSQVGLLTLFFSSQVCQLQVPAAVAPRPPPCRTGAGARLKKPVATGRLTAEISQTGPVW